MKVMRLVLLVAACLSATACTTSLQSAKVSDNVKVPSGILYSLPAVSIEAKLAFLPVGCTFKSRMIFQYDIVDAAIKHQFGPDAQQQHVFDYTKLNSPMKLTTANVQMYSSGMIKSINTEVDDRTAEVMGAIGGTVLNLVKASAFLPGSPVFDKAGDAKCPATILRKISEMDRLRKALVAAKAGDKEMQQALDELEKAKAATEAAKTKLAAAPTDEKLKADAETKAAAVTKLSADTKGKKLNGPLIQEDIVKAAKVLTAKANVLFVPQTGSECTSVDVTIGAYLAQFLDSADTPNELTELQKVMNEVPSDKAFRASVCVKPAAGAARTTAQQVPDSSAGLLYRLPVLAQITIAQTNSAPVDFSGERWVSVPQFGTISVLSLENKQFDKNTLKVTFAEDGALNTLDFTAQASAERGAVAVQGLSKTYFDVVALRENAKLARDKAEDAAVKKALADEIAGYDGQIQILAKQRELDIAKGGGKNKVQLQIDATELETNLIKKQIELEKQRREYEKLKAEAL